MRAKITKVQILTDREAGDPIFYCHASDDGHDPYIDLAERDGLIEMSVRDLFKVKGNPQRKNRADIYMSVSEARALGRVLMQAAGTANPDIPRPSAAKPHEARSGRMELPDIIWARYLRSRFSGAVTESDVLMRTSDGWVNVDFEARHSTHIKMGEREIHIGITLSSTERPHDGSKTTPVWVNETELQRPLGRPPEQNPVPKVRGRVLIRITKQQAAGLGELLRNFDEDQPIP